MDRRDIEENPYELSDFDKSLLPKTKRLSIPIDEPLLMRQVADILRGIAMQLDINSRRTDVSERTRRFMDLADLTAANRKIKDAARLFGSEIKEGRPPTGQSQEQYESGGETVIFPRRRRTHDID